MSRKIRLITALLLLSLCLGAAAIFVSANDAETRANQLVPDEAQNLYYADFENGVDAAVRPDGSTFDVAYKHNASNPESVQTVYGTLKGDKYISFRNDGTSKGRRFNYALPLNSQDEPLNGVNFDYVVFDVDISTDMYCYNENIITVAEYNELSDEEKAKAYPAYAEGMKFTVLMTKTGAKQYATISLNRDDGGFYLQYEKPSTFFKSQPAYNHKVYLSNQVGTTDHLTVVMRAINTATKGEGNLCAFYLNGDPICALNVQNKAKRLLNVYQFVAEMPAEATDSNTYSLCFDNISANVYATGYQSSVGTNLSNFGFGANDKISDCIDVVYNANYTAPGAPFVSCAGEKVGNPALVLQLLKKLEDGGTIIASDISVEDFTPAEGITNFEVICEGDAQFTLSEEAAEKFAPLRSEGTGVRYYSKSILLELEWQGINGEKIASEYVLPGTSITLIDGLPDGVVDINTLKFLPVLSWNMCFDGIIGDDTTYPESPLGVPTEDDITICNFLGNRKIILYPVVATEGLELAYSIFDSEGYMFFGDGDTLLTYTDISNLQSSVSKAPQYAEVILNGDGETAILLENIEISAGQILSFDLNGQKIKSSSNVFVLGEGATFLLYSSVSGAEVEAAEAIINVADGTKSFFASFGIDLYDEEHTDDTLYKADSIVSTGNAVIEDETQSIVYVEGGSFVADTAFDINMEKVVIWLYDATVETAEGGALFTDSKYAAIAFMGTTVVSEFAKANNGNPNIFVMPGNVFTFTDLDLTDEDIIYMEDDTFLVRNNNPENTVTLGGSTATITFASVYSDEELPEGIAKVEWLYPDGTAFKEAEYWYIGSALTHPEYDADDIPATALNNGWFDMAYTGWANQDGGLGVNAAATVFKPAAYLVPNLKGAKMNVSLYANLSINVYVPAPGAESGIIFTQDGVHAELAYDGMSGFALSASGKIETDNLVTITYNEVEYYGIRTYLASYELDGAVNCYAKFIVKEYDLNGNGTIEENEKNILLTQDLSTNFMRYVAALLLDSKYGCGTEEAKVMFDTLQYKRECYRLYHGLENYDVEELGDYNSILAGHSEDCACKTDINNLQFSKNELKLDYAEISDVIKGYSYSMSADAPEFLMYVPTSFENVEIAVSLNGVRGNELGIFKTAATLMVDEDGEAIVVTVGEVDYYVYSYDFGSLCNAAEVMEIEVKVGGRSAKGSYSLAKHIEQTPNDVAAKALYAAAKTFYNYKVD